MKNSLLRYGGGLVASLPILVVNVAGTQAADPFYKGKTITVLTSTGSGGAYDLTARTVTSVMPRHLPGKPTMIVKNMPGGGHTRATNFLYNRAPKDGTTIGTVSNTIPMHQVLSGRGVRYDASKFNWIGSTGISNLTIAVWHTTGVKTIKDMFTTEVPAGATGAGSGTFIYTNVLNNLVGTKFKIVAGYRRSGEINLAMERGEIGARGGGSYSGYVQDKSDWIKSGKIRFIAQIGAQKDPAMGDVPLYHELGRNAQQRKVLELVSTPVQMGRPYLAPPGLPLDRVALLRRAFTATMKDKGFLAEAKKRALDLDPSTGEQIAKVANDTINAPPDLVAQAKAALKPPVGLVFPKRKKKKKKKSN